MGESGRDGHPTTRDSFCGINAITYYLLPIPNYSSPKKRVAKFCARVGESALALRIAAAKKA